MQGTSSWLIWAVVLIGFMYLVMIRPQQKQMKKRQELMKGLRVRDRVITYGGLYGRVTRVSEDTVLLAIADNVEVEVSKQGIASVENIEDMEDGEINLDK